ncbi:DUF2062 domain-containing protein [Paenibacillus sp. FA6]|uniref:DUF2062 domain-containing protein n=1 Tax=Paenibacillus sp. FA6 TaxID=3413029 RepID=UPI003F65544C
MKLHFLRKLKYNCLKLLRIKQSDHQVVVGFIAGFFHCWFPTFGLGLLISVGLAKLLRGNLVAALIAGTFGTVIWPLLFYLNYVTGTIVMSLFSSPLIQLDEVIEIPITELGYSESAHQYSKLGNMSLYFIEGSIINSILFSVISYFILRFILKRYRRPLLKLIRST